MDLFSVLNMLGGLALFLYGMNLMGDGLTKVSGGKLEKILEKLTSNPLKAVVLGAGVTAVIQSSSATTVMVVGFVNSGIMKLSQAIGIIMGANVGTTITSWVLSLSGIESEDILIQLLKPSSFSPVLALIGVILLLFSKKEKKRDIGGILIGFAILMTGMEAMSGAVEPLKDVPQFTNILTMFSNPFLGMLVGALLTAVIQSSSASVGILQALCATGKVSFATAIPIIMGQNIGTCVTAMISGIGANKNAKRAALVHLYFNVIGTVLFMIVFYTLNAIINFAFLDVSASAAGIAIVHSVFNVTATAVLLPFTKVLERLAYMTIKPDEADAVNVEKDNSIKVVDERFLDKPAFAIKQCKDVSVQMAKLAKEALFKSIDIIENYDEDKAREVLSLEETVDRYEDELGTYLVKLSGRDLSERDSRTLSMILHCISDLERISDHAVNIVEKADEINNKKLEFSKKSASEIRVFSDAVREIVDMAVTVYDREDLNLARSVEPLEEVIDRLNAQIKKKRIKRIRKGKCSIEMGFVLSDLTTNYERIADHCSNIAVCLIQLDDDGFDTHEYLETLDKGENTFFREKYLLYKEKYKISKAD